MNYGFVPRSWEHNTNPFKMAGLPFSKRAFLTVLPSAGKIRKLLFRLFDPNESDTWLNLMNFSKRLEDELRYHQLFGETDNGPRRKTPQLGSARRSKEDFGTSLYYACEYGLPEVARWLVGQDENNERLGLALHGAVTKGHADIIKMILHLGADPNTPRRHESHSRTLFAAVSRGDSSILKLLLDAGADINTRDTTGQTVLHCASRAGNPDIVQLLVSSGHPLEVYSGRSGTPLSTSAIFGNDDAVEVLVRNGANVHATTPSPFVAAAKGGSLKSVKLLLDAGPGLESQSMLNTALYHAAKEANVEMMSLLISRGANIDGCNSAKKTPLKGAIASQQPVALQFVLDNGANINFADASCIYPVNEAFSMRNTAAAKALLRRGGCFSNNALFKAIDTRDDELLNILLDHGADPNMENYRYGNVLQYAAKRGAGKAIKLLLEAGANTNAVEGEYGTALQAAAAHGKVDNCRLLLNYGALANPSICGIFGNALQAAADSGAEDILRLLLDHHGTDVNVKGGKLCTALQVAAGASDNSFNMVRLLLERGANPNITCGRHKTAFVAALSRNNEDVVRLLLHHGAEIEPPGYPASENSSRRIQSTLELAVDTENPEIVQLLLGCGLDVTRASNEVVASALYKAATFPDTSIINLLVEKGARIEVYGGYALLAAVENDRLQNFDVLLKHGADPNYMRSKAKSYETWSSLQSSIRCLNWPIMHRLLDAGANVNLTHPEDYPTALTTAIQYGEKDVVLELLKRGADVNTGDYLGTPVGQAADMGDEELANLLLDRGAELNVDSGELGNPLQAALRRGYYDMAHLLLERGADPHLPGMYINALVAACKTSGPRQLELVKRLVAMGCDLNEFDEKLRNYMKYDSEVSCLNPLSAAASSGSKSTAKLLLELGANINAIGGVHGNALQLAAAYGHTELVKFFIEKGANVNLVAGKFGTALQAAVRLASKETVQFLLEAGADVNFKGGYYGSALQAAAEGRPTYLVNLLLRHGADITSNPSESRFSSPLQASAYYRNLTVAKVLLENGADVNAKGGKYGTVLQAACSDTFHSFAARRQALALVKFLLEKGADVNAMGGEYNTALQAAAYHDLELVRVLLQHGADPDIGGGRFGSPIQAAKKRGLHRIVKLLRENGAVEDVDVVDAVNDPCVEWVYGDPWSLA
jgi:ankyrin repeat protein